jgi:CDGSH-type Zn-finger protein
MLIGAPFQNSAFLVRYSQCSMCANKYLILLTKSTNMSKTTITVNNNGSLKVEGDFEIVDKNGGVYNLQGREIVSICRCGLSKNKPFCDGSHKEHFEHEAIAFDLPPKKVI